MAPGGDADLEGLFRTHWWAAVAVLTRVLGDPGDAEDAVQEACAAALSAWPRAGIPDSPTAWLVTVGRRRAVDRRRREGLRLRKESLAASRDDPPPPVALGVGWSGGWPGVRTGAPAPESPPPTTSSSSGPGGRSIVDDQIGLVLMCCHPALAIEARVPLTLRSVCGLSAPEIAAALLLPEATVAKRLTRARAKIRTARIPLRIPEPDELPARLAAVCKVVYLLYTEGYTATAGPALTRPDLCATAVELARRLVALRPRDPELLGLLALLLLTEARRPARTDAGGRLVTLDEQDRGLWDRELLIEGIAVLGSAADGLGADASGGSRARADGIGVYCLWAAIAACHSTAPTAEHTDWARITTLYDHLYAIEPTVVVAANRAVALAMASGPAVGLAALDEVALDPAASRWPQWHIARAEMLVLVGRQREAAGCYRAALALPLGAAGAAHVRRRVAALGAG